MAVSIVKQGPLLSFPAPPGNTNWGIALLLGPASYVVISAGASGAPCTGGFPVTASQFGLVNIVFAFPAMSSDGKYMAIPFPKGPQNGPQTSMFYQIVASISGAETSGDLSASSFLFMAIGG